MCLINGLKGLFNTFKTEKIKGKDQTVKNPLLLFYGVLFYKIGTGSKNGTETTMVLCHFCIIMNKSI